MGRHRRGIRKATIMEIQQVVGVQTRARVLALAAEKAGAAAGSMGRKAGAGGLQISCLQLRSHRLSETLGRKNRAAGKRGMVADGAAAAASRLATGGGNSVAGGFCLGGGGADCGGCVSDCSSNASCESVVAAAERKNGRTRSGCLASEDGDAAATATATATAGCDYDGELERWKEKTSMSSSEETESSARPTEWGKPSPRASTRPFGESLPSSPLPPSETEMEEFFLVAERQERKRFADKYNYDVVKDVPMEGRYKWFPILS